MHHRRRGGRIIGWILAGLASAAAFALVLAIAVQVLWNRLMPTLFGLSAITYWQAVGLLLLSQLLFRAPVRGHGHGWRGRRWSGGGGRGDDDDRDFRTRVREYAEQAQGEAGDEGAEREGKP